MLPVTEYPQSAHLLISSLKHSNCSTLCNMLFPSPYNKTTKWGYVLFIQKKKKSIPKWSSYWKLTSLSVSNLFFQYCLISTQNTPSEIFHDNRFILPRRKLPCFGEESPVNSWIPNKNYSTGSIHRGLHARKKMLFATVNSYTNWDQHQLGDIGWQCLQHGPLDK